MRSADCERIGTACHSTSDIGRRRNSHRPNQATMSEMWTSRRSCVAAPRLVVTTAPGPTETRLQCWAMSAFEGRADLRCCTYSGATLTRSSPEQAQHLWPCQRRHAPAKDPAKSPHSEVQFSVRVELVRLILSSYEHPILVKFRRRSKQLD